MKSINLLLLLISLSLFNKAYADTWYLDDNNVLKNDDMPELSIHNKKGVLLFYISNKKLPVFHAGKLVKITSSAALIDSIHNKDKTCIQVVAGANSKQQDSKNIYIIQHNKIKAFQTNKSDINCETEL